MLRITILLTIALIAFECRAQAVPQYGDTTKYWHIETNDGNEFIGRILGFENGVMILATDKFGTIQIRQTDLKSMEEADPKKIIGNQYWSDNFQSTRYFWMPNGYGLKGGESYYQNVWIFFNQFSVGITDKFSVSAGLIPTFLLGADITPVWVNGKVSLPLGKKAQFGGGVLYFRALDFSGRNDGDGAGITYGVLTLGSRDHNASFGVGYGFTKGNFSSRPVITISGMTRLGPRGYLMTENYIFPLGGNDGFGLISIGGRRLIKRVGLDFGGFIPVAPRIENVFIIPWLGLSVPLGKHHLAD